MSKRSWSITYKKDDVFLAVGTSSMAHCVSADLKMGKGIAVYFKSKFYSEGAEELKLQNPTVGGCVVSKEGEHFVYNLVTKNAYHEYPTLVMLLSSVIEMKNHAVKNGVKKISMPKIGCGLDKLSWPDVEKVLIETFSPTNIEIEVFEF